MLSRLDSEVIITHEYTDIVFYYHVTIMHHGRQSQFRFCYLTYCFVMHLQHPYTHTQSHTQHATLLIPLMFTPHRMFCRLMFISTIQFRGGLSIKAIRTTHCLREKDFFFLSDSTTRPSDLPLNVIVESANSHSGKRGA